jgi:hypothetical protein
MARTIVAMLEGMAMEPVSSAWEPDRVLNAMQAPDRPRHGGHISAPTFPASSLTLATDP